MMREIEVILNQLLPEHIKNNNPVITELFRIFLEYISETNYSKISNLSNLVNEIQEEKEKESKFNYKKNPERKQLDLKMSFINLFANNLNDFFNILKNDNDIDAKLTQYASLLGVEKSSLYDMSKLNVNINDELITCSKSFAQLKGTNVPFNFLSNILENQELDPGISPVGGILVKDHIDPNTGETQALVYEVESSLHQVVFNKAIRPLVHPVGFDVIYTRILKLLLEDHFNLEIENYGFEVKVFQQNGRTLIWKDELDVKGNVTNKIIKSFKTEINSYNIEELDIKFATGERLYRVENGDLVYYDVNKIPHNWPSKYYTLEYSFRKRVSILTKDKMINNHWSIIEDEYDVKYDLTKPDIIYRKPVEDLYKYLDNVNESKSLQDIQLYEESLSSNNFQYNIENYPEPNENISSASYIIMNNPIKIGNYHKFGDKTKIEEDEDLFWFNTDYYVDYYTIILNNLNSNLAYSQDMYETYSTRKGRKRIGKWLGPSDPRLEKDTRDVPNLTGKVLLAKIKELENEITKYKMDISYTENELLKVLSSRETFNFVIEGNELKDNFDVLDLNTIIDSKNLIDTFEYKEENVNTTLYIDLSNNSGLTVGSDVVGIKPIGNEDVIDSNESSGIYSYSLINGEYKLLDYISFIGEVITLDSQLISDYKANINELNIKIQKIEQQILEITSFWGFAQRTKLRYERNSLITTRNDKQIQLDKILNKYK